MHKKGFTLIELLVVIAIISILASVVLASLNTAREKSRDAKRVSDVKQIQLALEYYFDDNGQYPTELTTTTLVTPGYLPVVPVPPVGTGEAAYLYAGLKTGCIDYHLGTTLENAGHDTLESDSDAAADDVSALECLPTEGGDFSRLDTVFYSKP